MIICSIPFNASHPREVAKRTGGKWNANKKVWVFENANSENEISPKLRSYIVTREQIVTTTKTHDSDQSFWNWFLNSGE
jgi:hypothetical protein